MYFPRFYTKRREVVLRLCLLLAETPNVDTQRIRSEHSIPPMCVCLLSFVADEMTVHTQQIRSRLSLPPMIPLLSILREDDTRR